MNSKPGRQLWLPLLVEGELGTCDLSAENPKPGADLMEEVLAPENLRAAYRRVLANKGAPGVDGMTVKELAGYLRAKWPAIREQLLAGEYQPAAVRGQELPKPGGGVRTLGIPTVLDRFIEQALLQVLQPVWDATFSDASYGFRPGRSAHQAVRRAQGYYREGYRWVVDVDLEKFFDRVNHDKLMALVGERVGDWRVRRLIRRYLREKLKLKVNERKSAVAKPRERSFLGFSIGKGGSLHVSEKAAQRFKERVRAITQRTRGRSLRQIVAELRTFLVGWRNYFALATGKNRLREWGCWIMRRLRSYQWKQWGSRGYRELRRRGVDRKLAWNTSKSAHGAWRLSQSPALAIALPTHYFAKLGLPKLQEVC